MQPLEEIRVVDLSRALAGPYCSMILGDLGAEVIKIEPLTGDETRGWGPPFLPNTQDSAYYAALNRNKKSMTLDLKQESAKRILSKLIQQSDILVQNFRVGTMEKLGFGYDVVHQQNPKLVYCSISGFGSTGPYSQRGGYDIIVQGMGGLMSITGEPQGQPMRVGVPIVDLITGMFAVQAILAALVVRSRTGQGQLVETSLLESQIACLANVGSNYLISGILPKRLGNMHPNITPYQPYATLDGYVTVAVGNDKLWQNFANIIGKAELLTDPRFSTNALRNQNREELNQILNPIFLKKTSEEWTNLLLANEIPAGPILTLDKVFADPQVQARNMVVEIEHPKAGLMRMANMPIQFSETPGQIKLPPPVLGEHTETILLNLGYTMSEIAELHHTKAI